jgi:hypothetical protein
MERRRLDPAITDCSTLMHTQCEFACPHLAAKGLPPRPPSTARLLLARLYPAFG